MQFNIMLRNPNSGLDTCMTLSFRPLEKLNSDLNVYNGEEGGSWFYMGFEN